MRKTTSSLIIVLILIVMAPLVGYFGTKHILVSLRGDASNPRIEAPDGEDQTPDEGQPDVETPQPGDPAEKTTYSIVLPSRTISAVQVASLKSRDGAQSFVEQASSKGISCTVMEKDGQYKVIHTGHFEGGNLSDILGYAKTFYSDAFMTQKALDKKKLEMEFANQSEADAFQRMVDRYFEIMMESDDFAKAVYNGSTGQGSTSAQALSELLTRSISQTGSGAQIVEWIELSKDMFESEYSDYEAFNSNYLKIFEQIINVY